MLLTDALELYCSTNPRITKIETVRRYRTAVNNLAAHLGRPATTDDLAVETLVALVKARQRDGHVATGTIRGEAEKLGVIARWWASRTGQPAPVIVLPPPAESDPVAWTRAEITQLLRAARNSKRRVGVVPGSIYWPALLGVAYDTGERINAIHQVEACDIDLSRRVVWFRRTTRKCERRANVKKIEPDTAAAVRRLLAERPVAPVAPILVTSLYPPLRWLLLDAGLPRDRCRKFHCLRRSHATHLHLDGGDATISLGHADPRVTLRSYLDRSQMPQRTPRREGWISWLFRGAAG